MQIQTPMTAKGIIESIEETQSDLLQTLQDDIYNSSVVDRRLTATEIRLIQSVAPKVRDEWLTELEEHVRDHVLLQVNITGGYPFSEKQCCIDLISSQVISEATRTYEALELIARDLKQGLRPLGMDEILTIRRAGSVNRSNFWAPLSEKEQAHIIQEMNQVTEELQAIESDPYVYNPRDF